MDAQFLPAQLDVYPAEAFVLDGPAGGEYGGNGRPFAWAAAVGITHRILIASQVALTLLLLAVTAHVTTDVAAIPLLWGIPLALYLLSFILVFAPRPVDPGKRYPGLIVVHGGWHSRLDWHFFDLLAYGEQLDRLKVGNELPYPLAGHHFKPEIAVRTYERGVEDETLACGTGVAASGLVYAALNDHDAPVHVLVRGGDWLEVGFRRTGSGFEEVTLDGPAEFSFEGTIDIS